MAVGRAHRVAFVAPPAAPKGRVHRVAFTGTTPVVQKGRVHRIAFGGNAAVVMTPDTGERTVEPLTPVVLAMELVGGLTADTWTWRQVSGPPVTLFGTGGTRTLTAPAAMDGTTVVIGVRASLAGVSSAERLITIAVLPQIMWTRTAADPVWRGVKLTF